MKIENAGIGKSLLPIAVFFYGNHTAEIDRRICSVRPRYVIVNPPHGLWGQIGGNNVLRDISRYKAAGIQVIGYLTSGYEAQGSAGRIDPRWYSLKTNRNLIKDMAEKDKVDGVFIDECSFFPEQHSRKYLKSLTDLAHSCNLITWGNVGGDHFDDWFFTGGGFDLMQSSENWHGQELSPVQNGWGSRISVIGANPEYTAQDAYKLTINAWQKKLAYCYVCNMGYTSLPAWFEEYTILLRDHGKYTGNAE